ncbi:MAG: TonB family protein [Bacteroidia bacterium]|nr:TonB family protein [Bacteroidia bacterium]
MSKKLEHIIYNSSECIPEQTMFNYIDKKLSPKEEHEVEKHLIDCELCSDALEGLSFTKNRSRITYIKNEVDKRLANSLQKEETRIVSFNIKTVFAIAASVLLLIGSIFLFNLFFSPKMEMKDVALNAPKEMEAEESPASAVMTDSNSIASETNAEKQPLAEDALEQTGQEQAKKPDFKSNVTTGSSVAESPVEGLTTTVTIADEMAASDREENEYKKSESAQRSDDLKAGAKQDMSGEVDALKNNSFGWSAITTAPNANQETEAKEKAKEVELSRVAKNKAEKKTADKKATTKQEAAYDQTVAGIPPSSAFQKDLDNTTSENQKSLEESNIPSSADSIIFVTDEMPEFPGGGIEMIKFISKNFNYPKSNLEQMPSTTKIYVEFIVTKEGNIKDAKVKKGINPELDKEALRVINFMPQWKPGKQNGKPVNVKMNVPIQLEFK